MAIAGLPHPLRVKRQAAHQVADFFHCQRGPERVLEHLLLVQVGRTSIGLHQVLDRAVVLGPQQVAHEQHAPGRHDAGHLFQDLERLGNVVNDAVGHDRVEGAVGERQLFGITSLQVDSRAEAGAVHVGLGHPQHMVGGVNGNEVGSLRLTAKLDGDLGGAGADIEDGAVWPPKSEEIRDQRPIDLGVVHGIVVAGLLCGVHDFGFEDAGKHW